MKINIKSNKGVTVTGLVIYVGSFLMICAVIGVITTFFYNNTKFLSSEATASAEYDVLNAYLAKEAKTDGNIIETPTDVDSNVAEQNNGETIIEFSNGNQYIYESTDKVIYLYNNVTKKYFVIANYVQDAKFENNGTAFSLYIKILGKEYSQTYNLAD